MNRYLRMTSLALAVSATVWGGVSKAADVPKSAEVKQSGTLAVANTLDFAPFEYLDADGKQTGIIIELAGEVAKLVEARLDIQRTPFPSMIPGLAAGRFKIAWETFSATPERLKQVDFVMFLKAGLAVSTSPDKKASFSGDTPLCGKRIGVSAGSASDFLVDKLGKECTDKGQKAIEKSVFNSSTDIVQAVLSDRVDGRMDDATASSYFEVTSKGQLVVLPTLYEVAPLGMAIAKDDKETAGMMVAALAELFKNGTYKAILEKYGMGAYAIKEPYFVGSMDALRAE
ncbi:MULTISPECIES: ABC transporter substrate-binding protein [unclassified Mesorhizobium]|uniref:ABC transporter substrate-binding protein n=1 Tax=unclassified Mesorhizobium TaxID=325217 RepID=UPI000FDB1F9C|nr:MULTISPECIES: ABC transporter substrate-binding protein [unclassified Mesorhizobium]TGR43624.1 ABC transporter substrate-binding protein [bacterium M00.F.Ca.ET.199.01.1.1]TGU39973.1 ABC transporter substrate-binding protein [bacterium M00.F.Ca.ET.156.01.1.1]TGV86778.1 ABC transporter substrate-binding protein [Mesorhizobium sp. M00.F.Ca.ET.149.01.1.1]TGR27957.1 ABC transporter substrate-binding protein [Mesorhizobium sp. M8A.F.Ca.ET.197.01.1.1]TGR32096.1 ABC transporter substrate-binding pr